MHNFLAWFTMEHIIHFGLAIPVTASILHTILPPWEAFSDFPSLQKYYKLFVYVVGYVAINARSTVWKSISVNASQQQAAAPQAPAPPTPGS